MISGEQETRTHIEYYKGLFGQKNIYDMLLDIEICSEQGSLIEEEGATLNAPFTMEEIESWP